MRPYYSLLFLLISFVGAFAQKDFIRLGLPLGHSSGVDHTHFSPNGNLLVSSGRDEAVLWEVSTGRFLERIKPYADTLFITAAFFSPSSEIILIKDFYGISAWDVKTRKYLYRISDQNFYYCNTEILFSKDKNGVIINGDSVIQIVEIKSGKLLYERKFNSKFGFAYADPKGRGIICDNEYGLFLIDISKDTCYFLFQPPDGEYVRQSFMSPNGKYIATKTNSYLYVHQYNTKKLLYKIQFLEKIGNGNLHSEVIFSPNSRYLAIGGYKYINLLDLFSGYSELISPNSENPREIDAEKSRIGHIISFAFNSESEYLVCLAQVSSSNFNYLKIVSICSGREKLDKLNTVNKSINFPYETRTQKIQQCL